MLTIKGLTKTYAGGIRALDGVDLEIRSSPVCWLAHSEHALCQKPDREGGPHSRARFIQEN
jgi:hypothetical protein